jgi:hypothetical protein
MVTIHSDGFTTFTSGS